MDTDQERLKEILAEAIARTEPSARAAYLDGACGCDTAQRSKVEGLIAAYEKQGDFVERTLTAPGLVLEGPGTIIGRYKLLQETGEGTFGAVYVAEQTEPVRRTVALKIIKVGMDTREVIARFEAERQALALMDHPNIAKVLDAGATETGRPYFVMELVKGLPITAYAEQYNLPTEERLQLFMQVCHGVQHAHQKGIIHRDLKPTNVLVTGTDGEPVPKIIDFGVAKALGQKLTEKTLFTAFDQIIGTPAYMSPEQAGLSGVDIDTRSDIYALGVLLYELLTGVTPFGQETLRQAALDEVRRMIRETEPPKPSTRLRSLVAADVKRLKSSGDRRPTEAEVRASSRRLLQIKETIRLVHGDLDWIVMKALEKDRRRRYETASALAEDLQRHRDHQPVHAGPPSTAYRARKFMRRHRIGVASAAAVVLALGTGLSVATWMYFKERQTRLRLGLRAYAADMGTAMRAATGGRGGVVQLLAPWENYKPDLRGWEWYYLAGMYHSEILTIQADTNELLSVAWSPDGTHLATGGAEGVVKIWDAANGRQLACLRGHTHSVWGVAWSPDGHHLASASMETTVKIWAMPSAREILTLRGHTNNVLCVAWSPDGTRLASGSRDRTVRIWDPVKGTNTQTLPTQGTVLSLNWTSDGTRLAAAGHGETVQVWDMPSGKRLWRDKGSGNPLFCAWSAGGKQLVTGGSQPLTIREGGTFKELSRVGELRHLGAIAWAPRGPRLALADGPVILIWNSMTGQEIRRFFGHMGGVLCLAWRPDGARIASAATDGTVRVWDAAQAGSSVTVLSQPHNVLCLSWHPDGSKLAAVGNGASVRVLPLTQPRNPIVLPDRAGSADVVAWNPAGTHIACGYQDGVLRVWDPANQAEIWHVQQASAPLHCVAWSRDSLWLASAGVTGTGALLQALLKIWDAASGKLVSAFPLPEAEPHDLAWSPDGNHLAVAAGNYTQILDAVTGKEQHRLTGHADFIQAVAWSPDSKRLATAAADATVRIWDVASAKETQILCGHAAAVHSVAWHPDGTRLVSGGGDGLIIWEPASGLAICSISGPMSAAAFVAWSPDGTCLALASGPKIRIYDSTPGRRRQSRTAE